MCRPEDAERSSMCEEFRRSDGPLRCTKNRTGSQSLFLSLHTDVFGKCDGLSNLKHHVNHLHRPHKSFCCFMVAILDLAHMQPLTIALHSLTKICWEQTAEKECAPESNALQYNHTDRPYGDANWPKR